MQKRAYLATDSELLAENIKGYIQPEQIEYIPTTLLTGKIEANLIAANSIGANAIRANAVTAAKIQTAAINAQHIAAGQISADKLAIGLGGNLLYNPIFANPTNGVPHGWGIANYPNAIITNKIVGRHDWVDQQTYFQNENIAVYDIDTRNVADNERLMWFGQTGVSVVSGKTYMFSAYVSGHRMAARLYIDGRTADGGYSGHVVSNIATGGFHRTIADASRLFVKFTAPSDVTKIDFYIMCYKTEATPRAVLFTMRPMLEECTEHATQPSAWQNAGVTAIHGGSIVTNSVTAQQIATNTITANEIATGTIAARNMAANSINASHIVGNSITADKLNVAHLSAIAQNVGTLTGGTISGTTITGNTISGGVINGVNINGSTVNGTHIEGGTIRGARIEGLTIEAQNIIGDVVKVYSGKYNGGVSEVVTINIPASTKQRIAYIMPILLTGWIWYKRLGRESEQMNYGNVTINVNLNNQNKITIRAGRPYNDVATCQGALILPDNTPVSLQFQVTKTVQVNENTSYNGIPPTEFVIFCNNA